MSLLIGSFAFDARIEARIISYYRKRSKAVYIAKSGIELATLLMSRSSNVSKNNTSDGAGLEDEEDEFYDQTLALSRGLAVRGLEHELGDGKIILDIVPEPARRNINNLGKNDEDIEQNLERIFIAGGITEDTGLWPVLIESFLDWTDKDSQPRPDGAETEDYYGALTNSYKAKNGPLDTVGELLLIKGYNQAILSGGKLSEESELGEEVVVSGIQDLLTTYGDGKVNVNAASARVLMTLPGVDDLVANAIIEEREGPEMDGVETDDNEDYSYQSAGDFVSRIPDLDPNVGNYITTASTIYRISSVGEVGGVQKKVWCIVTHEGGKLNILRWREED
ncbi:hypothetical protein BVX97_01955 [bacterium E08(2017)]|nr:hypothetical protein BVX97_01955 [bacterium E08(2017)]